MPIKDDLLEILICPQSKERLKALPAETVAAINERIAAGAVTFEGGARIKEPLEEALATVDNQRLYAIKDGIPIMLVDESIPTAQLGDAVVESIAKN